MMKKINVGKSGFEASEIVLGCMRIDKMSVEELSHYVDIAMSEGITLFDHADIYGGGYCEELFGKMLDSRSGLRDKIQIQSKCSIRDGYYDFSKDHILTSVDNSLKRLKTRVFGFTYSSQTRYTNGTRRSCRSFRYFTI